MRFRYQGYPVAAIGGGTTQVYRPSIPVLFIGPAQEQLAFGLLDTGADDTLIPIRFAAILGVTPGQQAPIRGISGRTLNVAFAVIDIQVRAYRWSALVGFYDGNSVLLGQGGVLEYFAASFNGVTRMASLSLRAQLPPPVMTTP